MGSPFFIRFFFLFIVAGMFFPFTGLRADPLLPFSPGEEIFYNISWQQIKAGTCSIKVLPSTRVNNSPVFHFQLAVNSNELVDKIYKIRDVMEGFVYEDFSGSLLYKQTSTGKRKKEILVEFFREKNEVVYSNFGGKRDPVEIPDHTFDPVGSFFRMRTLDFEVGNTLTFPVSDGKKIFLQKGEVVKKEKISIPSGTIDTFVLVPSVTHFSGVFEKSKDPTVRVWISADEKKIPVRIQIKVVVGSIIFDLASYKPGA
ncbi:MAG: DUF3108 domain-containing protein [Desulfobacteraceae bacterium]|nr:DUF3108 domain-containing protein [Desulfobacteraceae bacterium]